MMCINGLTTAHRQVRMLKDIKHIERQSVRKQLYETLYPKQLHLDLVAAIAGDRRLTTEEQQYFRQLLAKYGNKVYVDMLFILTHQHFAEESARYLWQNIIFHKNTMERLLSRSVGISVAAMDYFANIDERIHAPSVISKEKIAEIAEIALKDGLTQLFDVSTFRTKLETEIKRYKRYGSEVSLIMMDIDDFKQINDNWGHPEGDRVLCDISRLLLKSARDLDICCRYGGEEFAVVLPQTGYQEAMRLAERFRKRVETFFKGNLPVTISLGVATCPLNASSAESLIAKADKALYKSKRCGKNKVTFCEQCA
jgi:diguanylate cyclase (GGDEF)-like protein